jgi:hypothetical protein
MSAVRLENSTLIWEKWHNNRTQLIGGSALKTQSMVAVTVGKNTA